MKYLISKTCRVAGAGAALFGCSRRRLFGPAPAPAPAPTPTPTQL